LEMNKSMLPSEIIQIYGVTEYKPSLIKCTDENGNIEWYWKGYRQECSSKFVPWSNKLTDECKDDWEWRELSCDETLPWSSELIEKYKDNWNWIQLSGNKSLPWSNRMIEKYKDKWDWQVLSSNESLPWSIELIDKYQDRWEWKSTVKEEYSPNSIGFYYNISVKKLLLFYLTDELVERILDRV